MRQNGDRGALSRKESAISQLESENTTTFLMCLNWASKGLAGGSFLATLLS